MGVKIARKIGYGLNSPPVRISGQEWIKILRGTVVYVGDGIPVEFPFPTCWFRSGGKSSPGNGNGDDNEIFPK
jgi:hypothetical protein